MYQTFDDYGKALHSAARAKGFYDSLDVREFNSVAKQLAMIHSEVTEVLEAHRKEKGEAAVLDEISDILIRVFDYYGALVQAGVVEGSLQAAFNGKVRQNVERPKMHGVLG